MWVKVLGLIADKNIFTFNWYKTIYNLYWHMRRAKNVWIAVVHYDTCLLLPMHYIPITYLHVIKYCKSKLKQFSRISQCIWHTTAQEKWPKTINKVEFTVYECATQSVQSKAIDIPFQDLRRPNRLSGDLSFLFASLYLL